MVAIRKAKIEDAKAIRELIEPYARSEVMLLRPIYEIYENIRDFSVGLEKEKIVACGSLHVFGKEYKKRETEKQPVLAEIRSLAVVSERQDKGIGTKLVKDLIKDGKGLGATKIFVLTMKNNLGFFDKLGFKKIDKMKVPQKIWQECVRCSRFPVECNEIALFLDI